MISKTKRNNSILAGPGVRRQPIAELEWKFGAADAEQENAYLVQTPPTANNEVLLRHQPEPRCKGSETIVAENGALEASAAGEGGRWIECGPGRRLTEALASGLVPERARQVAAERDAAGREQPGRRRLGDAHADHLGRRAAERPVDVQQHHRGVGHDALARTRRDAPPDLLGDVLSAAASILTSSSFNRFT